LAALVAPGAFDPAAAGTVILLTAFAANGKAATATAKENLENNDISSLYYHHYITKTSES
jgi:hypothetical protein